MGESNHSFSSLDLNNKCRVHSESCCILNNLFAIVVHHDVLCALRVIVCLIAILSTSRIKIQSPVSRATKDKNKHNN